MALQGERLVESYELRRRGDLLHRMHRQQRITDDIITKQRQIIEGTCRRVRASGCRSGVLTIKVEIKLYEFKMVYIVHTL